MLSLIIPIFNEEGAAEDIIRRADAVLDDDEIIIVDDGSTDRTSEVLSGLNSERMKVITHNRNKGNGAAIMAGVDHAQGDWIGTIDADGTYFPEDIPDLMRIIKEKNVDMVVGWRQSLMGGPFFHGNARSLLRKLAELASGKPIADVNSGLRIVRKEIIDRYRNLYPKRFSLHLVLTICTGKDGYKIEYVPMRYGTRIGTSKLSPGFHGIGNFAKFLVLIALTTVKKSLQKHKNP